MLGFGCCCAPSSVESSVVTLVGTAFLAGKEKENASGIPLRDAAPLSDALRVHLGFDARQHACALWVETFDPDALFVAKLDAQAVGNLPDDAASLLCLGDYILSAGGKTGLAAVEQLHSGHTGDIFVRRPPLFAVSLTRDGGQLGIMLKYDTLGASVYIASIEANASTSVRDADLAGGDRIVAVNGRRGPSEDLLREMERCTTLELQVSRLLGGYAKHSYTYTNMYMCRSYVHVYTFLCLDIYW